MRLSSDNNDIQIDPIQVIHSGDNDFNVEKFNKWEMFEWNKNDL